MIKIITIISILIAIANAKEFRAKEYAAFPRLFDLDDYHECMSQNNGLYCLGTFHLKPIEEKDPVYHLMEEYSSNRIAFNRTLIHRGFCVSQHCARTTSNATLRFGRCVAEWAKDRGFRSGLHKLEYCRSNKKLTRPRNIDTAQRVYIYVLLILLILNVIGTVCDVNIDKKEGIVKLLSLWSVRANWRRLTTISYEQKDPRLALLAPLSGARVVVFVFVMTAHSKFIHYLAYLQNSQDIERELAGPSGVFFTNGTTLVQIFTIFSSFLCEYNLLLSSKKKPFVFSSIPRHILKRIVRIAPVHLLLVGFGATWYAYLRDGPIWPLLVETEQDVCRTKFWAHALFINNFVDTDKKCFVPTWSIAVDMQLYIISLLLTFILAKIGRGTLKILIILYFASLFFVSTVAYFHKWVSLLYMADAETMHNYYKSPSYERLYITPLGSISSCLAGIILARCQFLVQEQGIKVHSWKLLEYTHYFCLPGYVAWVLSGAYIRDTFTSPMSAAAYVGVERLVFHVFILIMCFGNLNIDSSMRRFFSWRGWEVFARLSLSVLMIHWAVNTTIVASRPNLLHSTFLDVFVDGSATWVLSYGLAVPVSVLVETPMQRNLEYFLKL